MNEELLHGSYSSLADVLDKHPSRQAKIPKPAPTTIKSRSALINQIVGLMGKSLPDAPKDVIAWIQNLIQADYVAQSQPAKPSKNEKPDEAELRKNKDIVTARKAQERKARLELGFKALEELQAEALYAEEQTKIAKAKKIAGRQMDQRGNRTCRKRTGGQFKG